MVSTFYKYCASLLVPKHRVLNIALNIGNISYFITLGPDNSINKVPLNLYYILVADTIVYCVYCLLQNIQF